MKKFVFVLILSIAVISCAQEKKQNKEDMKTDEQKVSYAIGQDIGKNFKAQGIDITVPEFVQGIEDAIAGTSLFEESEIHEILGKFQQTLQQKQQAMMEEMSTSNKVEGEKFFAENKTKEGVIETASGLQYKVLRKGTGTVNPTDQNQVKVHYSGTLIDGTEFDSSYKRNEPITFGVTGVIPGWTEALKLMTVGDKWEVYIPYNLAYGERGKMPTIEPFKTLIFEIELLEIL